MKYSAVFAFILLLFTLSACALPKTEPYRVRESQFQTRLEYLRYCDHYWLARPEICVD